MGRNLVKIWEREYTLHRMVGVVGVLSTPFAKQQQGFIVSGTAAVHLPNGNEAFCVDPKQWEKFNNFLQSVFNSPKKFKKFLQLYNRTKKDLLQASRTVLLAAQKSSLDPKQLTSLFNSFFQVDQKFMVIGQWWAYYLAEIADETVPRLASEFIANPEQQRKFIDAVLSPEKMSQIREERKHLLQIYLAPKARLQKVLQAHVQKFNWIPCINIFNPPPWDEKFFRAQLKRLKSKTAVRQELAQLNAQSEKNKKSFRKVRAQAPSQHRHLLDHAHLMAFLKDDRDDTRRQAYYNVRRLYQLVAAALKLSEQDLLYFTPQEIIAALQHDKSLSRRILSERKKGYAMVIEQGKILVLTGVHYKQMLKLIERKNTGQTMVQGTVASPGKVWGTAKVVPGIFQLDKVKKGDILITVVTHPDYLPAMRIARAIVTDEGGLTSHAAIVSRELRIPCIVGTKHATSVFKDGDLIEVDANKGIVKKL